MPAITTVSKTKKVKQTLYKDWYFYLPIRYVEMLGKRFYPHTRYVQDPGGKTVYDSGFEPVVVVSNEPLGDFWGAEFVEISLEDFPSYRRVRLIRQENLKLVFAKETQPWHDFISVRNPERPLAELREQLAFGALIT